MTTGTRVAPSGKSGQTENALTTGFLLDSRDAVPLGSAFGNSYAKLTPCALSMSFDLNPSSMQEKKLACLLSQVSQRWCSYLDDL